MTESRNTSEGETPNTIWSFANKHLWVIPAAIAGLIIIGICIHIQSPSGSVIKVFGIEYVKGELKLKEEPKSTDCANVLSVQKILENKMVNLEQGAVLNAYDAIKISLHLTEQYAQFSKLILISEDRFHIAATDLIDGTICDQTGCQILRMNPGPTSTEVLFLILLETAPPDSMLITSNNIRPLVQHLHCMEQFAPTRVCKFKMVKQG